MLTSGTFWVGVGVGVTGVWAYHKYVAPRRVPAAARV